MEPTFSDFVKQREIHFRSLNPDANDARDAMLLLMEGSPPGTGRLAKDRVEFDQC